jgi:hypothetical protein
MRTSDLIQFIRSSSSPYESRSMSDLERLSVIKASFPRQDLLAWFEEVLTSEFPAEYYIPALLLHFAAMTIPRQQTFGIICGHHGVLSLFPPCLGSPKDGFVRWPLDSSGRIFGQSMPPLYKVGQICGFFATESDFSAAEQCLTVNFYNSQRLLFMREPVFAMFNQVYAAPYNEREIYRGLLQDWNGRRTYLLHLSRIPRALPASGVIL